MIRSGRIDLLSNMLLVFIVLQASRQSSHELPADQRPAQPNSPDSPQGPEQPDLYDVDQDDKDDLSQGIKDVEREVRKMKKTLNKNVKELKEQGIRSKLQMDRIRASIQSELLSGRAASPAPLGGNNLDDILDSSEVSSKDDAHHGESYEPAPYSIEAMKKKTEGFFKNNGFILAVVGAALFVLFVGIVGYLYFGKSSSKKKRETIRGRAGNIHTI
ncbi:MAG: hypothetical protein MHMPM18_001022 [Marteilia pararefringens]